MSCPPEVYNSQMSEADLAHAFLKEKGSPINFGELCEKVMEIKPVIGKDRAHVMAGIHTELNLDGRFVHIGQGLWGLREWMPEKRILLDQPDEDWDN